MGLSAFAEKTLDKKTAATAKTATIETAGKKNTEKPCEDQIKLQIKGMVCDFCAGSMKKVFKKQKGFSGIDVNLDTGQVVVSMQKGKTLDNSLIKKLIKDAGYSLTNIQKGCEKS